MYKETTSGITVEVTPIFVPEHSDESGNQFIFQYKVVLMNESTRIVQLQSRHWVIRDGHGKVREVRGPGVIGEYPILRPGEKFEYQSFCPLPTPTGNMRGTYTFKDERGLDFDVRVPVFFLRRDG